MGLNIKNEEVECLAADVARMTGESKTEAIRQALKLRARALKKVPKSDSPEVRMARLIKYFETKVWPKIPPEHLGKPMTKAEREDILGYGEFGA